MNEEQEIQEILEKIELNQDVTEEELERLYELNDFLYGGGLA